MYVRARVKERHAKLDFAYGQGSFYSNYKVLYMSAH